MHQKQKTYFYIFNEEIDMMETGSLIKMKLGP